MENSKDRRTKAKTDRKQSNIAAYIRVRITNRANNFSLEAQRRNVEKLCEREGWTLIDPYGYEGQAA